LAELIVTYIVVAAFLAAAAGVGFWLYQDAGRRGQNRPAWLVAWAMGPVAGLLFLVIGLLADTPTVAGLVYVFWLLVIGLGVLLVYFSTRPADILFDADGKPVHPKAIEEGFARFVPGEPPPSRMPSPSPWLSGGGGWQAVPAGPPQAVSWPQTRAPGAAPPQAQAGPRSKVRCPNCNTVFDFAPSTHGATHVTCPRCGVRGTV
jgi:hypothetical protein